MKAAPVHILATCRSEELLPATLLVFKTLRVGFPTANITLWINWLPNVACEKALFEAAKDQVDRIGAEPGMDWASRTPTTTHHKWISEMMGYDSAFWICDTDMIFWKSFEDWDFSEFKIAGRYTPQFFCKFANAITRPRLHSSLLYINPYSVREAVAKYGERFPPHYCTPRPTIEDLVFPRYIPVRAGRKLETIFHDTGSLLYQAIGGQHFTEEQLEAYSHLNSGTISDWVAKAYPEQRLRESHFAIFENPELARGCWRAQEQFYKDNAV